MMTLIREKRRSPAVGTISRLIVEIGIIALAVTESVLSIYGDVSPLKVVAIAVAAAGLPTRHKWPWLALAATLPALIVSAALLAAVIALFSLAVAERSRWRLAIATTIVGVGSSFQWVGLETGPDTALSVMYTVLSAAAPVALGLLQRTHLDLRAAMKELRESHKAEHAHLQKEVLTQERTRIAREMHDVVSHHVSLIAVQAGALQVAYANSVPGDTAVIIRGLAGQTLNELRQMITVLRSPSDADPISRQLSPQPGLDEIDELVAMSGIPVTGNLDCMPRDLPPTQQRTIYRTVQEALTNIRKHAQCSPTVITVTETSKSLAVEIANSVPKASAGIAQPQEMGHGLVGLSERAELAGGKLRVRSTAGQFSITLELPRNCAA